MSTEFEKYNRYARKAIKAYWPLLTKNKKFKAWLEDVILHYIENYNYEFFKKNIVELTGKAIDNGKFSLAPCASPDDSCLLTKDDPISYDEVLHDTCYDTGYPSNDKEDDIGDNFEEEYFREHYHHNVIDI